MREVAAIASQFVTHRSQRSFEDITSALIDGMEEGNADCRALNAAALVHLINNRKQDQKEVSTISASFQGKRTQAPERADDSFNTRSNKPTIDLRGKRNKSSRISPSEDTVPTGKADAQKINSPTIDWRSKCNKSSRISPSEEAVPTGEVDGQKTSSRRLISFERRKLRKKSGTLTKTISADDFAVEKRSTNLSLAVAVSKSSGVATFRIFVR